MVAWMGLSRFIYPYPATWLVDGPSLQTLLLSAGGLRCIATVSRGDDGLGGKHRENGTLEGLIDPSDSRHSPAKAA